MSADGVNVKVTLTANGRLQNLEGAFAGQTGNLIIVSSPTTGCSLTSYGNLWSFSSFTSSMTVAASAYNKIHVYNDGIRSLAEMYKF